MPAVGITDGSPACARDHLAVALSCFHLARRWAALECRSAWLVVDSQVKGVYQYPFVNVQVSVTDVAVFQTGALYSKVMLTCCDN